MHRQFGYVSSCTVTYSEGTASVSCVDSTSSVSGHQVILLQLNNANRVVVVNVSSGGLTNAPVIPGGRYCIMVLQGEDNEVRLLPVHALITVHTTGITPILTTNN